MLKKLILLSILFYTFLYANIELKLLTPQISNAQTALLVLNAPNIHKAKLTILNDKKINLDFQKNSFRKNSFYALIPVSYYEKKKSLKIIISYIHNKKKIFKAVKLSIVDGKYKSETIQVSKKKVKPKNKAVQKRTQKEYDEAMKIYNTISSYSHWSKPFIQPMKSKITSAFGTKRIYNGLLKSYHSGTDYKAKVGEPIVAVNDGIVKLASNRFYAGNSVVIDHGQGIYTCYFHLSKIAVKVGEKVKQNQRLGLSGSTGRVTGPHLHFSARVHGIQVDPLQLIYTLNLLVKK